jgi:hypothetical protein
VSLFEGLHTEPHLVSPGAIAIAVRHLVSPLWDPTGLCGAFFGPAERSLPRSLF